MAAYVIERCDSTEVKAEFNEAEKGLWSWDRGPALFEKDSDQEAIEYFHRYKRYFSDKAYRLLTFPSGTTLAALNTQDASQFNEIEGEGHDVTI